MRALIDSIVRYISPTKVRLIDLVDRCCCRYTPLLLTLCMFITGAIDTFGKPINCLIPAEFPGTWVSYVHQYCYITGTYLKVPVAYSSESDEIDEAMFTRVFVDYYQWVPFILIGFAIITRLPHFFLRKGHTCSVLNFVRVHELCERVRNGEYGSRLSNVDSAAGYIFQVVKTRGFCGIGNTTICFYALFKLANLVMVILQITLLNIFVGYNNPFWGVTLARQVLGGSTTLHRSNGQFTYFPRVAYCEFDRDFLGAMKGGIVHETRCALGINILNEKVFLLLYFWYYALLTMCICSAVYYTRLLCWHVHREHYVLEFLALVNDRSVFGENAACSHLDGRSVKRFSKLVLGRDGLLLFHFLSQNVGKLEAVEVCSRLYQFYQSDLQQNGRMNVNVSISTTNTAKV